MQVDQAKLDAFMGKLIGHMTGAAVCYSIWLGDELGFYREMAGSGPRTAGSLAEKTGCHARLVREWLDSQAAGGLVSYNVDADTYELGPEAAMAIADDTSPVFVARGMNTLGSMFLDMQKVVAAFRSDGALSWKDHHPCLFRGTEWFFRTGYRAHLAKSWIPALDGVEAKLDSGARVADVGCGHGASVVAMAMAYPNSHFSGFDFHEPSIETSRERAREAGVSERTDFRVASATGYTGQFDLICFFDCLHDMGDPLGAARHAREHLLPGGTVLLVEPFAIDPRPKNIAENPLATLFYVASTCVCTPNSLSQAGGASLGTQAGEAKLRRIFQDAGFLHFRRVAETPKNMVFEARVEADPRTREGDRQGVTGQQLAPEHVRLPAADVTPEGKVTAQTRAMGNSVLGDPLSEQDSSASPKPSEPALAGIVLSRDLMFTAKVRGTAATLGYGMRVAGDVGMARMQIQRLRPRVIFVDLTAGDLVAPGALRIYQQIAGPETWFVAAGPHVQGDVLSAAKAAGCHEVMPRSQFSANLPALMHRFFGRPADQSEATEPGA
jgi:2-polyprenyl-3-methyl-5-hydroxy-6-metoxy-1,4-benzoquinol methylase